jgi:broad specificity phosphatase PhoE
VSLSVGALCETSSVHIKLVRHGQSAANVGRASPQDVGDHNVELTELGHEQAEAAGRVLGAAFLRDALIYRSPYRRTRETCDDLLRGAGLAKAQWPEVYEDPRLREVEHGYYDYEAQTWDRVVHGWFYYRFRGGESPADCFDRVSTFLETLMRQVQRREPEHVVVVTHGLTIRCFVMRFLHLTVEQFEQLANPGNAAIVTIGPRDEIDEPTHVSGRWATTGLRLR